MLDFAEFVAINKFDRKGAARRAARRRQAVAAQPGSVRQAARRDAGVRHHRPPRFNDDGVTALYQALRDRLAELGLQRQRRHAAAASTSRHSTGQHADRAARARPLSGRNRRHGARLPRGDPAAGPAVARELPAARRSRQRMLAAATRRPAPVDELLAKAATTRARPGRAEAAGEVAGHGGRLRRRRVRRQDPRQGDPHPARTTSPCPAPRSARSRCRGTKTTAKS